MVMDTYYVEARPDSPSLPKHYVEYLPDPQQKLIERLIKQWEGQVSSIQAVQDVTAAPAIEERFLELAERWERETGHISSTEDMTSNRNFREIVELGWAVVPYLLKDLEKNQRFWFPALHEITNVRPFDQSDLGNSRRMLKAWITWGKRKKII